MTQAIRNLTTRASLSATASHNARWFATLLAGSAMLGTSALAVNNVWESDSPAGSSDWNTPGNWSLGRVPANPNGAPTGDTFDDAIVNIITPGYPILVSNADFNPRDVKIGVSASTNGRLDVRAGLLQNSGWFVVGDNGGAGVLNVANTAASGGTLTGFGVGSGGLQIQFRLYVGGEGTGAANGLANINTAGTVAIGEHLIVGNGNGPGGTLNLDAGTVSVANQTWIGQGAGGVGTLNISGGTLNANNWVAIGREGGSGTVNMTGGTITKTGGGNFIVGASGPGSMTQSGGLVDIQNGLTWIGEQAGATSSTLTINGTAEYRSGIISVAPRGALGVLNLDGGTVRTNRFSGSAEDGSGAATGNGTINFNGTQIIASASNAEFTRLTDTLNVASGGMKVDSNNFVLTAPMPMSGVGGVTKSGAGSLTLSGANTFSGASSVTGGTLNITTDSTGGGALSVADGATLGVVQAVDTGVLQTSGLTLGNSTLSFTAASAPGNPAAALLKVNGALSRTGQTTINLVDPEPAVGSLPIVSYTSKTGTGTFVVGALPDGVTLDSANPITDIGSVISLNITRVNAPHWAIDNTGVWDTTTNNWTNFLGGAATTFQNGDPAIFEDLTTFLSLSDYDIALNTTVIPGGSGVTFDNAIADFIFSGSGKISGTAGITKLGGAGVIIPNTLLNDFTGPVTIEGGSISVDLLTNAASPGPLGKGNLVLAGGTLNYTGPAVTIDRGFQINAGPSASSSSEIILANNVTMSGPVTATNGKLRLSGAGILTLSNPGTISLANGPQDANPASLVIDGGGLTLNGAGQIANVVGNTQIGVQDASNPTLTLSGSTTLNVNRFQVGFGVGSTSSILIQGASQLHKSATGWLSIGNSNNAIATVTLRDSGKLITDGGDFNVGDTATSNGSLIAGDNAVVTSAGPVYIGKNGTTGLVTLTGNATMSSINTDVAGGAGSHGDLNLQGTSTYTSGGRMQVGPGAGSTGTVVVEDAAQVQVNSFVSVGFNGGGTLTVKEDGTFNTTDDLSVNEAGDVPATVTVQDTANLTAGGTVFIGRNPNKVGTLNVSGTATFDQTGSVAQNLFVGLAGTGTLNINGGAIVNAASANGVILGNDAAGTGTVNLNGGTLTSKRVFGGAGTATFNFDGGFLKAGTGATAEFMTGLDNAFVEDGGAVIDSNGQNINIAQPLLAGTTANGGLTKFGTGTLTLNGINTYTGLTLVTAGALGGSGTIAGPVTVQSGAALAPGSGTGTLTANAGVTFNAGSAFVVNIDDSQAVKNGRLDTTGNLNVTGAALQVNAIGAAASAPYTIVTAGSVTGPFASVPAGVSVTYNANSITITPPATTPFDSWMANFPTLTGPNAAKTADPDGDGMTNLEEFALDGNPTTGAATGKVRSRIETVGGEQALVVTLPVRAGATFDNVPGPGADATVAGDGVVYLIQGSNNLTTFDQGVTEVPVSSAGMPGLSGPGWTYRTFRLNGAVPARGVRGFLSVKVQATP
jgi:autotransporter-associated beta strand protein/T5SS/PEP-CTERM-associated repeat protein